MAVTLREEEAAMVGEEPCRRQGDASEVAGRRRYGDEAWVEILYCNERIDLDSWKKI